VKNDRHWGITKAFADLEEEEEEEEGEETGRVCSCEVEGSDGYVWYTASRRTGGVMRATCVDWTGYLPQGG